MKDTHGNGRISGLRPYQARQAGREGGREMAVVTKLLIIMLSQLTWQDTKLLKEFGDNSGASTHLTQATLHSRQDHKIVSPWAPRLGCRGRSQEPSGGPATWTSS